MPGRNTIRSVSWYRGGSPISAESAGSRFQLVYGPVPYQHWQQRATAWSPSLGRHLIKLILFKSGAINSSFGRFMADYHLHPSFVLLICNQLIEQCFISFQGPSFVCPVSLSLIAHFLFFTWSEEMCFTVGHNYKLWKAGFFGSFESFRSMQPFPVTVPPKTMALMQHTATWQARKLSLSPTTFYYFRPYSYYKPSKSVFIE